MYLDPAFTACCNLLKSNLQKERLQGVTELRTLLTNDSKVASLDQTDWECLLNTFVTYLQDRQKEYAKNPQNTMSDKAVERRTKSGATLRSLVELSYEKLSPKQARIIIAHLVIVLSDKNKYYNQPVARDFTIALRTMLSYKPYREHLPTAAWRATFDMCTDALVVRVDDQVSDQDPDPGLSIPRKRALSGTRTQPMDVDDDGDAKPNANGKPDQSQATKHGSTLISTVRDTELARILSLILTNDAETHRMDSSKLFNFFLLFFTQHRAETPAHLYLLTALNHVLAEIAPNCFADAQRFGDGLLPYLLLLWDTRPSRNLKLQLLICMQLVFELNCRDPFRAGLDDIEKRFWDIGRMHDKVQHELRNRRGGSFPNLPTKVIECVTPSPAEDQAAAAAIQSPFHLRTLRGERLGGHACSWLLLDFAADLCHMMVEREYNMMLTSDDGGDPRDSWHAPLSTRSFISEDEHSRPSKRVRRMSVWQELKEGLDFSSDSAIYRISYLQLLVFMIEKHAHEMNSDGLACVWDILTEGLTNNDKETYHWVCMGLRSMAHFMGRPGATTGATQCLTTTTDLPHRGWPYVWAQATHRIASTIFGPPSMALMHSVMVAGLLPKKTVSEGVQAVVKMVNQDDVVPLNEVSVRFFAHVLCRVRAMEADDRSRDVGDRVLRWVEIRLMRGGVPAVPEWLLLQPHLIVDLLMACVGDDDGEEPMVSELAVLQEEYVAAMRLRQLRPIISFLDSGQMPGMTTSVSSRGSASPDKVERLRHPGLTRQLKQSTKIHFRDGILAFLEVLCSAHADTLIVRSPTSFRLPAHVENISTRSCAALGICTIALHTIVRMVRFDLLSVAELVALPLNDHLDQILAGVATEVPLILAYPRSLLPVIEQLKTLVYSRNETPYQFRQTTDILFMDRVPSPVAQLSEDLLVMRSLKCAKSIVAILEATCILFAHRGQGSSESQSSNSQDDASSTTGSTITVFSRGLVRRQTTTTDDDDNFDGSPSSSSISSASPPSTFDKLYIEYYSTFMPVGTESTRACLLSCSALLPNLAYMQASPIERNGFGHYLNRMLGLTNEQFATLALELNRCLCQHVDSISDEQLYNILHRYVELLSDYRFERDQWVNVAVIQSLMFLAPKCVAAALRQDKLITEMVKNIYHWLTVRRWQKDMLCWRARLEMPRLLIAYLRADPSQAIIGRADPSQTIPERTEVLPGTVFMNMFKDVEFTVRMHLARTCVHIFDIYKHGAEDEGGEDHLVIFSDIHSHLEVECTKHERMVTRILTLGELVVHSEMNRKKAVCLLVEIAKDNSYFGIVNHTLQDVAVRLGFDRTRDLLAEFQQQILYSWIVAHDLVDFPFRLFGYDGYEKFLVDTLGEIVPQLLLHRKWDELERVSERTGIKMEQLLREGIATTFAFASPLYYENRSEEAEAIIKDCLQVRLGSVAFNKLYSDSIQSIVFNLLLSIIDPSNIESLQEVADKLGINSAVATMVSILSRGFSEQRLSEPCQPFYPIKTVFCALGRVTSSLKGSSIGTWFHVERLHRTLQRLHENIQASRLKHGRRRFMGIYRLIISIAGNAVYDYRVARMILHAMAVLMYNEDICLDCCGIVMFICECMVELQPEVFVENLTVVVPVLVDRWSIYADLVDPTPLESQCRDCVVRLLEQLLLYASNCKVSTLSSRAILSNLGPFPSDPAFAEVCRIYQSFRVPAQSSKVDLGVYTARLLASPSSAAVQACVRELREILKAGILSEGLQTRLPELHSLVGRLMELCARESDTYGKSSALATDICRLLAEVYPFFNGNAVSDQNIVQPESAASGPPKKASREPRTFVFHRLSELLLDNDIVIVGHTHKTLRSILDTQSGHDAFKKLDSGTRHLLDIFRSSTPSAKTRRATPSHLSPTLEDTSLWKTKDKSHREWIVGLCCSLLDHRVDDEVFGQLGTILMAKADFANEMLPFLVHRALADSNQSVTETDGGISETASSLPSAKETLSQQLRSFFQRHATESKEALKTLLNVVVFLRQQPLPGASTSFDNNKWLDLDFFDLAKAALRCEASATALLFVEIGYELKRHMSLHEVQTDDDDLSGYQKLLLDIFRNIDEPDSFYGIRTTLSFSSLSQGYEHEGSWFKNLGMHETYLQGHAPTLSEDAAKLHIGLMKSLNNMGFHHLSDMYFKGLSSSSNLVLPEAIEFQYEIAWRNGTWDHGLPSIADTASISKAKFDCLRALHLDARGSLASMVTSSFGNITRGWRYVNLEGSAKMQSMIKPLLSFLEIEEGAQLRYGHRADEILPLWDCRLEAMVARMSFHDIEKALALRAVVLDVMAPKPSFTNPMIEETTALNTYMRYHLINLARIARKSGQLHVASTALYRAGAVVNPKAISAPDEFLWFLDSTVEQAKQLWTQGEASVAIRMIRSLIRKLEGIPEGNFKQWKGPKHGFATTPREMVLAKLLNRLGQWTAEARAEHPSVIMTDYLEKAATLVHAQNDKSDSTVRVLYTLAKYADEQYQAYAKSDSQDLSAVIARHKEEIDGCKRAQQSTSLVARDTLQIEDHQRKLELQLQHDEAEYDRITGSVNLFLEKGVENYLRCLELSEKFDMCVFRLCALWFSNSDREPLNRMISTYVGKVPSRKWIVLIFQLSARLSGNRSDSFQTVLTNLVEKICRDHPYHSVYQIFALRNAGAAVVHTTSLKSVSTDADRGRITAASKMINRLSNSTNLLKETLKSIELLCKSYTELAYAAVPKNESLKHEINKQLPIDKDFTIVKKTNDFLKLPVTTLDLIVDHSCEYKNLVCITRFRSTYSVIGGMNLPKVIRCVGSDGKTYRQLVKVRDDTRQDAVMQQIFKIVHVLLKKNSETRKRRLGIRTYKVVPLSPRAGLLEWVEDTEPLAEWLVKAHPRYNEDDLNPIQCRNLMVKEHKMPNTTPKSKLQLYQMIASRFQPVFRHFFMEHFQDPLDWFDRRLAYTRSVASTSIMGYALGLGDRHASNILVDKGTAELVHIDLGIAFDQGKFLPTPELVPFRLTRDLVDGMGVTGIEGVFRRCCEETLKVLRSQSYVLMTILEVFRFDPLHQWTISPIRAQRIQHRGALEIPVSADSVVSAVMLSSTTNCSTPPELTNKEAERALMSVRSKLSNELSVERHVNDLIQVATNPENLARMFPGWQSWI